MGLIDRVPETRYPRRANVQLTPSVIPRWLGEGEGNVGVLIDIGDDRLAPRENDFVAVVH